MRRDFPAFRRDELAEKGADADLLQDMLQFVAQRMMEMDVESLCAAFYGERSSERLNSRNGYRERLWETRAGCIERDLLESRNARVSTVIFR